MIDCGVPPERRIGPVSRSHVLPKTNLLAAEIFVTRSRR